MCARRGGAGAMFRNRKGVEEGRESLMIKREGLEGGGEHNGALAVYLLTLLHHIHDITYVEWLVSQASRVDPYKFVHLLF